MRALITILLLVLLGCEPSLNSSTTSLKLTNKKLTAIPDSVFSMVNLRELRLDNGFVMYPPLSMAPVGDDLNRIKQIPEKIDRLQHLKILNLSANDLRSLPKGITKLHQLDTLDVSFNIQLNVLNELVKLDKMHWLKYLSIVGTNTDKTTIEQLQKSLPNTKIVTEIEELFEVTDSTSAGF